MREVLTPSLLRRAGVSLGLLMVYAICQRLPVPFVELSVPGLDVTGINLFALGIQPYLYGFLAVELLSLLLPVGRRLRRAGLEGRRKLSGAAVTLGLLIACMRSTWLAGWLLRSGYLATASPALTRTYLTLMLIVGAAALFWLARKASDHGLADGFCLLLAFDLIEFQVASVRVGMAEATLQPTSLAVSDLVLLATVVGIWRFLGSSPTLEVVDPELTPHRLKLPAFSTSLFPAIFVALLVDRTWLSLIDPFWTWLRFFHLERMAGAGSSMELDHLKSLGSSLFDELMSMFTHTKILALAILIPLFCVVAYWLFGRLRRVESELVPPAVRIRENPRETVRQRFLTSMAVQTAGPLVFGALAWFASLQVLESVFFVDLVVLTALARDVVDQIRLTSRNRGTVKLLDLDNVHLAAYLKTLFRSEDVDVEIQGYHFRRLLFFFGPLFKMQVRVAREDEDRAWEILESQEVAEV